MSVRLKFTGIALVAHDGDERKNETSREVSRPCVFCGLRAGLLVTARNKLVFAVRDNTPATALHTLVFPYRHAPTYFDLTKPELTSVYDLLLLLRSKLLEEDPAIPGFNVGTVSVRRSFTAKFT
jgi:HIT domain